LKSRSRAWQKIAIKKTYSEEKRGSVIGKKLIGHTESLSNAMQASRRGWFFGFCDSGQEEDSDMQLYDRCYRMCMKGKYE
jgi:hypothetical protein